MKNLILHFTLLWINMSWDENVKKICKKLFILLKVSQILSSMSHNQLNTNFFSVIIQNYSEWISSYSKKHSFCYYLTFFCTDFGY